MTDRELLELAAKAAGYDSIAEKYGWDEIGGGIFLDRNDPPKVWNPLTDDGDALRLAVKLRLNTLFPTQIGRDNVHVAGHIECLALNDPYAATRRAIVRAAAEIGRNKT